MSGDGKGSVMAEEGEMERFCVKGEGREEVTGDETSEGVYTAGML